MHRSITLIFIFLSSLSFSQVSLTQIDPMGKVMQSDKNVATFNEIHPVAYNEVLTVQLLLRSSQPIQNVKLSFSSSKISATVLNVIKVYRQGYIKVSPKIISRATDHLLSVDSMFPDPLFPETNFNLVPAVNVPITLEIPISKNIPPGVHVVGVNATNAAGEVVAFAGFTFKVYNISLPGKKLNYVNWYHDFEYKLMNNGKQVDNFSAEYWQQFRQIVQASKDYGQNIFAINPLFLIQFKKTGNTFSADYTQLEKALEIILKEVGMDYVLARQFANRAGGWESHFQLQVPKFYGNNNEYMMELKPVTDPEAVRFYNWFLTSYHNYLRNKKVLSRYLHHIADEPIAFNESSYKAVSSFIRKRMPGLKIIEAVSDAKLVNYIDILIVQLGELSFRYDEVVSKIMAAKKELWFYTGNHPQGNYANRFIELQLIKTRLLPWVAYRYNMTGYLHWGLNFWGKKPFDDASKIYHDAVTELPGGDAYIIYPGYKSVILSTRFLEMRNGLNDVALLSLLKQKNPNVANSIALQLVKDFQNYQTDTKFFIAKKKEILEHLSL